MNSKMKQKLSAEKSSGTLQVQGLKSRSWNRGAAAEGQENRR